MTDPMRWTENGGDATPFEHDLVSAGQQVRLPNDLKQEIWASIAAQCPVPTALQSLGEGEGAAEPTPAASSVAGSTVVKGIALLAVVGGLTTTGYFTLRNSPAESVQPPPPTTTAVASSDEATTNAAPSAIAKKEHPEPQTLSASSSGVEVSGGERPRKPIATDHSSRASQLREESRMVLEARRRLRAGDAPGALRLLEQARVRFPDGALGQEREALTIEALAKSGSHDAAQRRADEFLRDHPESPHAADVRADKDR